MRKFWLAALAATTVLGATPALADRNDDDDRDYRYSSQHERAAAAAAHTRRVQERNSQRLYAQTRRAQAAHSARLHRDAVAQRGRSYDHAYYDDAAYERGRREAEREFRRFADRNRDGQVSRREYEWAMARW